MENTIELDFGGGGKDDSRIVKAAVWAEGIVYMDWRHSMIFERLIEQGTPSRFFSDPSNHGFIDQYGLFYNRREAGVIAFKSQQTNELKDMLFSEDLWDMDGTPRDGGLYDPGADAKCQKKIDTEKT